MKIQRKITQIITPETTSDGAGVTLKRGLGTAKLNYLDPFLLFDHFGSANPDEYIAGFPMHPHRGIETVTYMLKGLIKHKDSSGNEGILGEGDIQWMTAGSGIMHEEMPQMKKGRMEGFQLWVNLPAKDKMMKPRYQEFKSEEIPVVSDQEGVEIKIVAGEIDGDQGVVKDIEANPTYLDIKLEGNINFEKSVPRGHSVFAYVFEGSADFGEGSSGEEITVNSPKLVVFEDGDFVKIRGSQQGTRFLLVSGKPLDEPIARYGPFVMNTREEIQQALTDLQRGTFVKSYE